MTDPAYLTVADTGLLATVQDLGRPGQAHLGVPRSGAVDPDALRLANRLVGNLETEAGIEFTLTGGAVRCSRPGVVAVTGASCAVTVDTRPVPWGSAVPVPAGATVRLGPAQSGLRSYLAVAGGIAVDPVLGSRATDLLSGLGPAPLVAGADLPIGDRRGEPSWSEAVPRRLSSVVRFTLGPREDWFTPASVAALDGARYVVHPASNRVGVRLDGPALRRTDPDAELASEPMVLGALQVPPDGRPVVFLHDHPTTGGYPVVGVVVAEDVVVCAQARTGDVLTFTRVSRRAPRGVR